MCVISKKRLNHKHCRQNSSGIVMRHQRSKLMTGEVTGENLRKKFKLDSENTGTDQSINQINKSLSQSVRHAFTKS